jgi:hypothetical protein
VWALRICPSITLPPTLSLYVGHDISVFYFFWFDGILRKGGYVYPYFLCSGKQLAISGIRLRTPFRLIPTEDGELQNGSGSKVNWQWQSSVPTKLPLVVKMCIFHLVTLTSSQQPILKFWNKLTTNSYFFFLFPFQCSLKNVTPNMFGYSWVFFLIFGKKDLDTSVVRITNLEQILHYIKRSKWA